MDKFQAIHAFCTVVDEGSFVAAADTLQTSKAAVSRYVSQLEANLGVRLLHRTTRQLSLTEEGALFLSRSRDLLASLAEAEAELSQRTGAARGKLRINVPVSYGITHLAALWGEFRTQYPQVDLDVTLADRVVDLVDEGYDMAVRIAQLPSSSLVSRRLSGTRIVLCASPAYLADKGYPATPQDLREHAVINYSYWAGGEDWYFNGLNGRETVRIRPIFSSNSGETCVAMALAGHGLALQPEFLIRQHLDSGSLAPLLPEYPSLELGIYAVYPSRKHLAPKLRALVDFLAARLA